MHDLLEQCHRENFSLYNGDSVEVLAEFPDECIDFSVYSPPFQGLYTYSPSERDLGNSFGAEDFFNHYKYIIRSLLRITKPGRVTACHTRDLPTTLTSDGVIGLRDFVGECIQAYRKEGWIYDGRIPIDKNQQAQAIRRHAKSLTMGQMNKDRSWSAPAVPDYILKFRKPGENKVPVCGGFSGSEWIEYANPLWYEKDEIYQSAYIQAQLHHLWYLLTEESGSKASERQLKSSLNSLEIGELVREIEKLQKQMTIPYSEFETTPYDGIDRCNDKGIFESWYDIKETDTIQGAYDGREFEDEKHITPMQLEAVRRCVELWSNPGEIVLDPFSGVGTTVFVAVANGRKGIGIELKSSYHLQAIKNVERVKNAVEVTLV